MDAFSFTPPSWTKTASRGLQFCCPRCHASPQEATKVWLNRSSPVIREDGNRQWQEFYECECGQVWWAWNSDRPRE